MKFNVETKLDANNTRLLAELRDKYMVVFVDSKERYCSVFHKNDTSTIFVNPKFFSNSSIAHELLHTWFKTYDLHSSNGIYLSSQEHTKLRKIFDKRLCDHIGNCQEHLKIFPKFIEMGYSPKDFLDSKGFQCDIISIKKLKVQRQGIYSAKDINRYIGYLISIYADHLPNEYSEHLNLLEQMDSELFKIVTDFWESWKNLDIEEQDIMLRNDFEVFYDFTTSMELWSENKSVV